MNQQIYHAPAREKYRHLMAIAHKFALPVGLIFLVALPFIIDVYFLSVCTFILINALFAQSVNLLFGYGGKLSFGHAAFFGVGAYTVGILATKLKLGLLITLPAAVLASGLVALVLGYLCIRRTGMYFSILTMAFGQFIFLVVDKWYDLTCGADGLQGIPVPAMLSTGTSYYYFALIVVGLSIWLIYRLVESPFGFALRALRDNPVRAEFNGLDPKVVQLTTFVVSAMFAGLAGGIFAPFNRSVAPAMLEWTKSSEPVVMAILGGQFTFFGPIFGATIFTLFQMVVVEFTTYWPLVLGTILGFMILFLPGGFIGYLYEKIYGVRIQE